MKNGDNEALDQKAVSRGFVYGIATIATLCLVVIAGSLGYETYASYQEMQRQRIQEASVATISMQEVSLAKNTLHDDGVVSVMIANIDGASLWKYFVSDTGVHVVEVRGTIPANDVSAFVGATLSSRVTGASTDLQWYDGDDISKISFRIQFTKQLGVKHGTPYNTYAVGYSEYLVTDTSSKDITINAYGSEIFDVMQAYLASKW
ncbi:MAG: hypothetical protein RBR15_02325 [Sphaerochaeta sp.]|nr:hypothetical protein [Sphaerochaeta sp.]